MSVIFTNDSHPPSNSSLYPHVLQCYDSIVGTYMLSTVTSLYVLLVLPLSLFVLYLGSQRWRVSTAAIMSHSDFFTYNMAAIELIAVFGYVFYYCSSYTDLPVISFGGTLIGFFTWFGQMLFPILTFVEHYLAVVHPITYLGLRQAGGVRIRNISTGCVWLMCLGGAGFLLLLIIHTDHNLLPATSMLILSLVVVSFFSLSVLRVLIRPRPGKVGGDRVQVDKSKQRAIHTIITIMGVLWLKFGGNVVAIMMSSSTTVSVRCLGEASTFVFSLPSSLVLPLLFLHRAGKLPNCKHNTESG